MKKGPMALDRGEDMPPGVRNIGRVIIASIALVSSLSGAALADDGSNLCDIVSLQFDNDEFGGTDRHYTGALRLGCVRSPPEVLRDVLPPAPKETAITQRRSTFSLGVSVYTPDDLDRSDVIEDDQPYAGWLYLGLGLERET